MKKKKLISLGIADIYATADIALSSEYSMAHADDLLCTLGKNFVENMLK